MPDVKRNIEFVINGKDLSSAAFKSAGRSVQTLQQQLNALSQARRGGSDITGFGTISAGIDEMDRAKRKMEEFHRWIRQQGPRGLTTSQVAGRAIASRDAWMQVFLNPEDGARGWQRWGSAADNALEKVQRKLSFSAAAKKGAAAFGLGLGLAGDIGGDRGGARALGAMGNIAGQAALGGMAAGPLGALAFGSIAIIREARQLVKESKEEAELRLKITRANVSAIREAQRSEVETTRGMGQDILPGATMFRLNPADSIRDRIAFARSENARLSAQIASSMTNSPETMAAFDKTSAEVRVGEAQLMRLQTAGAIGNLLSPAAGGFSRAGGGLSRLISGGINRIGGTARGPLSFLRNLQTQLDLERAIESPAMGFQRQLNDLGRMQREGIISPDLFNRSRENVLQEMMGMLPGSTGTPGLGVTEARFLTRGRDSDAREMTELQKRQQRDIEAIRRLLETEKGKPSLEVTLK